VGDETHLVGKRVRQEKEGVGEEVDKKPATPGRGQPKDSALGRGRQCKVGESGNLRGGVGKRSKREKPVGDDRFKKKKGGKKEREVPKGDPIVGENKTRLQGEAGKIKAKNGKASEKRRKSRTGIV